MKMLKWICAEMDKQAEFDQALSGLLIGFGIAGVLIAVCAFFWHSVGVI